MSACELAVSPTCPNINNKRVLEDSGNNQSDKNNLQQQQGVAAASGAADAAVVVSKRRRGGGASTGGSSSAARCFVQATASTPACAAGPTTLSALCALFPEMAEQVRRKIEFLRRLSIPPFASRCSISFFFVSQPRPPLPSNFSLSLLQDVADVLYSCGDDIDAAVRRLSELRLRPDGTAVILEKGHGSGEEENDDGRVEAACSSAAAAAAAASGRATPDLLPPSGPGSEAARSGAASPGPPPAAGGGERKSVENGNGVASCARQGSDPSTSAAAASASPAEVDAWADGLVREMAAASDVGDAKARASTVLRGFESALLHRVAAAAAEASPSGNNSGNVASAAATAARAAALERDCSLLKRAVALQASRLQGAAQARRQESLALSRALHEARARVQQLELTNFALAAHLRAATDGGAGGVGGGGGFGGGGGSGGGSSHGGGRGGAAGGMNGLGGQGGGGFASPSRDVY